MNKTMDEIGAGNQLLLAVTMDDKRAALRNYREVIRREALQEAQREVEELRVYLVGNHQKGDRSWRPMATAYGVARRAIEKLLAA